jgi:hypothetical protein
VVSRALQKISPLFIIFPERFSQIANDVFRRARLRTLNVRNEGSGVLSVTSRWLHSDIAI